MAAPNAETIELEPVLAPREPPTRANLWRACVRWQIDQHNDAAVEALLAIDPWRQP